MGWKVTQPSTIYAIRCSENGKVYIGRSQCLERRLKEHLTELKNGNQCRKYGGVHEASDFQKDFDKYGENCFEVYVLESSVSPDNVKAREAHWIAEYRATDRRYGYNKAPELPASAFSNFKDGKPQRMWLVDFDEGESLENADGKKPPQWTGRLIGRMHNEGVSQTELAEELGIVKSYVGMILNGERKPPGIQKRMEDAFNAIVERRKNQEVSE